MPPTDRTRPTPAPADLVLRGGVIRTLAEDGRVADALAARAGVVVALDSADVAAVTGPDTEVVELDGRTAIPGVNDAHLHGAWLGARWPRLFFGDHAESHQGSERLVDTAGDRRRALLRAWRLLAELGITSYTEPGIGPGEDGGETGCFGSDMLQTYLDLHREGSQTSRITLLRLFGTLDGESRLDDFERGIRTPVPSTDPRWLAITGVKIFADGIPPLRSAWVRAPYADGSTGALLTRGGGSPLDAFRGMVASAHSAGLQIAVHATGDRSIAEFLDVLESLGAVAPRHPHYVVHGDLVTGALLERMSRLGVGIAVQPLIAAHTGQWAAAELGASRTAAAWPLEEVLGCGVVATVTSDAPIAHPDWRRSLDAAMARLGRADSATRARLLRSVTVDAARQDGAAEWKGSLEVGRAADIAVLADDPLDPHRPFADLSVELTLTDGRVVFDRSIAAAGVDTESRGRCADRSVSADLGAPVGAAGVEGDSHPSAPRDSAPCVR